MEVQKADQTKKRTWSEVNKAKKDERRKWKEINLEKKLQKKKLKTEIASNDVEASALTPQPVSTLSIAVPGSILENAQTPELRSYLAGQIARAACIFQANEVIVFDDYCDEVNAKKGTLLDGTNEEKVSRQSCIQLGRILQYLECPQYLRKSFFPIHNDLKYCGLLNPLNAPHHLGLYDDFLFREGVVLNTPVKPGKGSIVNVGLLKQVQVDKVLLPGIRCTVKLRPQEPHVKKLKGIVVSPKLPRSETGVYWGYSVRIANSLSKVFSQCPYKNGYDLTIGTSDKGTSVDDFECPKFKHLLIMFGGVKGLEAALENDGVLDADDPSLLFDSYLNTLPEQGSKTIRTEEAILISLAALRPKLNPEYRSRNFDENNPDFQLKLDFKGGKKVNAKESGSDKDVDRFDSD
ncbi:putative methyltransferase C9orf114 [Anthonomus grandis grandis]|uniref:putative methyltransferase C9orf114 n=1 Tax=Anthonomus grandis grandis TaxID=2921223 RepID=UPI0021656E0A|nr:putative methyltransferase C9orf114 [Anthonomus grandis grandis]